MIRATLWDFGGVILSSPFEGFARYEAEEGLPEGFIRRLNATNPDANAWARLERNEIGIDEFCTAFEKEASVAGGRLDARRVLTQLRVDVRPAMVEALRRCKQRLKTALLTNNIVHEEDIARPAEVMSLFDVVIESSVVGIRKPDPRFYALACERLGVEAAEAVFLDDLGVNLKPARQMGITTIKVDDPDRALAELERVVGFPLR